MTEYRCQVKYAAVAAYAVFDGFGRCAQDIAVSNVSQLHIHLLVANVLYK